MLRWSSESASSVKEPVGAAHHVFVVYKLTPVSLLNAASYASDEQSLNGKLKYLGTDAQRPYLPLEMPTA
jgi:hypothetical protein